jgi:hypothetical protein
MTIALTGTGGLFKRIGVASGRIQNTFSEQGLLSLTAPNISAGTFWASMQAQFASTTAQSDILDGFVQNELAAMRTPSSVNQLLQTRMSNLLVRQVNDDTPLKAYTPLYAMVELIRQMIANGDYVNSCAVSATVTPNGSNIGTAVLASSVLGPQGVNWQHVIPETLFAKITNDSYNGSATPYSEPYTLNGNTPLGGNNPNNMLTWNSTSLYGATQDSGSGAQITGNIVDAAKYQGTGAGGNILNNGDFLTFTSNTPNQWTITVGAAGTQILAGGAGSGVIGGSSNSLSIAGDGSTLSSLQQQLGNAGGSSVALKPGTVYAGCVWLKKVSGATGNMSISLVNGSGSVVDNINGTAQTPISALDLSTLTTSYVAHTFFFQTPAVIPASGIFLRMNLTTAINASHSINVSNLALCVAPQAYVGGPYVAIFSGGTASQQGDNYNDAIANDYATTSGSLTNKTGFGPMFNWLFNLRTSLQGQLNSLVASQGVFPSTTLLQMQLPISTQGGGTLIADSFS